MAVKNCFIRGSVVRYVQLPAEHVDTQLLEDATRRGMFPKRLRVTVLMRDIINFDRGPQPEQTPVNCILPIRLYSPMYIIKAFMEVPIYPAFFNFLQRTECFNQTILIYTIQDGSTFHGMQFTFNYHWVVSKP